MFIPIKSRDELVEYLKDYSKREVEVVIHYNCSKCDDEQVTYGEIFEDTQINDLQNESQLYVTLECTECGHMERFLHTDYIQGIEVDE